MDSSTVFRTLGYNKSVELLQRLRQPASFGQLRTSLDLGPSQLSSLLASLQDIGLIEQHGRLYHVTTLGYRMLNVSNELCRVQAVQVHTALVIF